MNLLVWYAEFLKKQMVWIMMPAAERRRVMFEKIRTIGSRLRVVASNPESRASLKRGLGVVGKLAGGVAVVLAAILVRATNDGLKREFDRRDGKS